MTAQPDRLAVVVVNFDSAALLAHNLTAVQDSLAERRDPDLAGPLFVVVDNYSTDRARRDVGALAHERGWLLLSPDANLGFGAGMAAGVAAARREGATRFLLLNPDAQLDGDSIGALLRVLAADPMTLAGPVIHTSEGALWSDGHDLRLSDGATSATRKRLPGATGVVPWLTGACLAMTDVLWDATGGFDDAYFLYWEDVELSWRVHRAGGGIAVVRDATAVHDEGGTHRSGRGRGHSTTFTYYQARNRLLFAARNLDRRTQLRWALTAPLAARRILLWSGRRAVLTRPELVGAAASGTFAGLRLLARPAGPDRREGPVRVLSSFPQPRPTTNPYIVMLKGALEARTELEHATFSWKRALVGRYDVFHAHWPEILVSGNSRSKALVRQLLFAGLLLRFRGTGTAVVRTQHNPELPRDLSALGRLLLRAFDRTTDLHIRINDVTEVPAPFVTIPHGHYVDWFARILPAGEVEPHPGRVAFVGLIRRYKAVDQLIRAFAQTRGDPAVTELIVAGRPTSPELAREISGLAAEDARVRLRLEFLSEVDLGRTVRESALVVLPAPDMHNSGTVLAALSLRRPVLVPRNQVNERLAREVGERWVQMFDPPLTGRHIVAAVRATSLIDRSTAPDLAQRGWAGVASEHVAAYRRAQAAVSGRRGARLSWTPRGRRPGYLRGSDA